ncbi:MAG: diguanylate cyclase [Candidatus Fermentibacteraceae bacterium]|nr:diguanylate cyclase [Candidatus Fermentibacteraceae bacterium]MBN2609329.1 diguanylate cyclase [Candidatus Fermentibacteraceae bacterium]
MNDNGTVLLADSDSGLLQVLGKVLKLDGFEVIECSTGMEVIDRAVASPPSLIACGYFLPLLDGLKVCRYLKRESSVSGVPFILLTPGIDPYLRQRAEWAGADSVRELPVRAEDFLSLCRSLASSAPKASANEIARANPPDRESILEKLCGYLENRVNRLEATWHLTEELGRTMSVREIFRRMANGILTGLSFDRVWLTRYLDQTDELVTEVARGRNMGETASSVHVREHADLPLGIAIREMVQVVSGDMDLPDERLWWAGSSDYVDTPLVAAGKPIGLIRCDRSLTGRKIEKTDLEALRHYAAHAAEAILNAMILEDVTDEREQMSAIMNSLDSGILVVDNAGVILQVTSRVGELFGKSIGNMRGKSIRESMPMLASGKDNAFLMALQEEKQVLNQPIHLGRAGTPDLVLNVSYLPFQRAGHFAGIVIMANDVTESYTLRESLRKKNEQLETISVIGSELNSTQDLDKICKEVIKALRRFFPSEAVTVFLAEGSRDNLTPSSVKAAATAGYDRETDPQGLIIKISETAGLRSSEPDDSYSQGAVASAINTRKAVNIKQVREDRRYVENLAGTRSELSVPMIVQDRVVGAIDIQSPAPAKFNSESERTVVALANHAATAVENAMLHSRILSLARKDKLTGLGNLRYFEEKLDDEFRRTDRSNFPFSLIMMDIDDFKHYNDSWGHLMGNTLLKTVVKAMGNAIREVDVLIRYGGEEFVCILPFTGEQEAAEIAERIRKRVVESSYIIPHSEQQPLGMVSISLGVSTYLTDVGDRNMLLKYADQRMYMAKRAGKNKVVAPALSNCQFAG